MLHARFMLVLFAIVVVSPAFADDPPQTAPVETPPGSERYFIAAMKQTDDGVKVRLVDRERRRAHWMGVGERRGDVGIVAADYASEEVVVQAGIRMLFFSLAGEPRLMEMYELAPEVVEEWINEESAVTSSEDPEGEPWTPDEVGPADPSDTTKRTYAPPRRYAIGIEQILREHPELRRELNITINPKPAPSLDEILTRFPEAQEWLKSTREPGSEVEPEPEPEQEQEQDL